MEFYKYIFMHTCCAGQKKLFCVNLKKNRSSFLCASFSSTYFPTILELKGTQNRCFQYWETNNGPNVVSLSIFGSNHQPGIDNNNKDLISTHSFVHYRQIFCLQYYLLVVEWKWGGGGARVGVVGGGKGAYDRHFR